MMRNHVPSAPPVPVGVQMVRDGLELLTQEQRLALAMEIVLRIDAPGCCQHLIRLANQATSTSHEITGRQMMARPQERV